MPESADTDRTVFPLRAAGIDIGSNAMRLLVGQFTGVRSWVALVDQRVPVRLGASVFSPEGAGLLSDQAMDAAVEALRSFRQRLDDLTIGVYRAAATSATREARNGAAFVERAMHEAGIALETITGGEEARLVWLAVAGRVRLAGSEWVFVDVGGGSVEVGLADGEDVLWAESHRMGTVRLLGELQQERQKPERFRQLAREYIDTLVSRIALEPKRSRGIVATGGNIEELARLCRARTAEDGTLRLPVADLARAIDELSAVPTEQRAARFNLRPDRADVIVPAGLVYERIARLAGADTLVVPNVGLKEGLLLDAVDDVAARRDRNSRQQRDIEAGAVALGRRYAFDEAHARHVARLAVSLFDQLLPQHGLTPHDRSILLAAALLHDIGQYISYRRHHKHSFYLIAHASLPDLTPRDTLVVALVARYHRRAEPSSDHEGYAGLGPDERRRVDRLAAVLRLADALDRQHRQHVRDIVVDVQGGLLNLLVHARGDIALETWAVEKKGRFIARTLGLDLDIRFETG